MRILIVFTITVLLFSACRNTPVSTSKEGIDTEVEFMFEKDSVKVYRFYDNGYHYFTTNGETMTTQKSGKTHYEENIKQSGGAIGRRCSKVHRT